MAVISYKYNFLYLQVPRTGCTSIGNTLVQEGIGEWLPRRNLYDEHNNLLIGRKHACMQDFVKQNIFDPVNLKSNTGNLLLVAGTRNPFDSLFSFYSKLKFQYPELVSDKKSFVSRSDAMKRNIEMAEKYNFSEWIIKYFETEESQNPRLMFAKYYTPTPDIYIKFEQLYEDFRKFLDVIGCNDRIELLNVNPTKKKGKDYKEFYSTEARELVENIFQPDLETFNYCF